MPFQWRISFGQPYLAPGTTPRMFFMLGVTPDQWWVLIFGIETREVAPGAIRGSQRSSVRIWLARSGVSIRRASDSPGKSDACPSSEHTRHLLTEYVGLQGGLSFLAIQISATNRMIQKGLGLVPGGGVEPP